MPPPLPPPDLLGYVGHRDPARRSEDFDRFGRENRAIILDLLPSDWTFEGKRVLDFGCGPGRVLRHFLDEAAVAEMHGCDIDAASVAWIGSNLSPPLHAFRNDEVPPLPLPDGHFDLIWSTSVLSVLTDSWSRWLCELHRVLRDDGLLIATFVAEGGSELVAGEPWVEERIGMNVIAHGQRWEACGPMVLHSPWWIREHWGRAFEIVELRPRTQTGEAVVAMRKRAVAPTPEELERIDPNEPRELLALRHNLTQVQREATVLRDMLTAVEQSWSWRLTRPLREAVRLVMRLRGRGRATGDA